MDVNNFHIWTDTMWSSRKQNPYVGQPGVGSKTFPHGKMDAQYPTLFDNVGRSTPEKLNPMDYVSASLAYDNRLITGGFNIGQPSPKPPLLSKGREHLYPPRYSESAYVSTFKPLKKACVLLACVVTAVIIIAAVTLTSLHFTGYLKTTDGEHITTNTDVSRGAFASDRPETLQGESGRTHEETSITTAGISPTANDLTTYGAETAQRSTTGELRQTNEEILITTTGVWQKANDLTTDRRETAEITTLGEVGSTNDKISITTTGVTSTENDWTTDGAEYTQTTTFGEVGSTKGKTSITTTGILSTGNDLTADGAETSQRTTSGEVGSTNDKISITTTGVTSTENDLTADGAESTQRTTSESSWSPWEKWSNCDVTCGSGKHIRGRQCLSTNCIGVDTQLESCYIETCPRLVDLYGTWVTWSSWSICGATCGDSIQFRSRVCNKDADDLDCVGDLTQTRECSFGPCPDCSTQCPIGTFLSGCTICSCNGTSGSGLVLTQSGSPLDLVTVTPLDFDYEVLDISDASGLYTVADICIGDALKFEKEGYIVNTVYWANPMPIVRLSKIIRLDITKNPKSAFRIAGGCVNLTCEANGRPEPLYYEWFNNNVLIENTGPRMTLNNLQQNDSGEYKCRSNNDYGSVYSSPATIRVENSADEFCDAIPFSNIVDLPEGCHIDGESSIDMGKCSPKPCSLGLEIDCASINNPICSVTSFERQEVQCEGFVLPVFIAKQCGCVAKKSYHLQLTITVLSKTNNRPVFQANVFNQGTVVGTTNWRGRLTLDIEPEVDRYTIFVQDTRGDLLDEIVSIRIDHNAPSEVNRFIYLRSKSEAMVISSDVTNEIPFKDGNNQSASFSLEIPPNVYYTQDGTLYSGQIKAFISTIDTSNVDSVLDAPGDFTAISEEGDEQILESYGMFRIDIEDDAGNILTIGDNVTIDFNIPHGMYEGKQIKVWVQDENGRWVYVSELVPVNEERRRKKRQLGLDDFGVDAFAIDVRGNTVSGSWWNFDAVVDQFCFSKTRVYKSNKFDLNELIDNAWVRAVTFHEGSVTTVSDLYAYTDYNYPSNGYCIAHPCNTATVSYNYRGYLIADYNDEHMKPSITADGFNVNLNYLAVDSKAEVNFDLQSSTDGPFYGWEGYWSDSEECSNAPIDHAHFKFYQLEEPNCTLTDYTAVAKVYGPGFAPMFWFSSILFDASNGDPKPYRRCYIKVVTNVTETLIIKSRSEIGTYSDSNVQVGDVTGTRAECTDEGVACMELRTPGGIKTAWPSGNSTTASDSTKVHISLQKDSHEFVTSVTVEISDISITDILMDQDKLEVSFLIHREFISGTDSKVYCSESDDKDVAASAARTKCFFGTNDGSLANGDIRKDFWGIKFH